MSNKYNTSNQSIRVFQYTYGWMSRVERDTHYTPAEDNERWANERVEQLAQDLIEWGSRK